MGNEKTLKKFGIDKSPLSHDEAVKNGSIGGKASVEERRQVKESQRLAVLIANLPTIDKNKETMATLGIDDKNNTNLAMMMTALLKQTLMGNPKAIKLYLEIMGEPPVSKIENEITMPNYEDILKKLKGVQRF
jgi:hypothetical protein